MAWIGVNSVLEPVVAWYSSSQALGPARGCSRPCASCKVGERGGWWRLVLALASTSASGWFWSEGYLAGPAGMAYLWFDGRKSGRKLAALPLLAGVLAAAIAIALSGGRSLAAENFHGHSAATAVNPLKGLIYSCQAIPEGIVLANLGVDSAIEAGQGILLMLVIALIWIRSRLRTGLRPIPNSLEAAGAMMTLGASLLVYSFRADLPYDNVRGIWVYLTIPQLGAIVFVAGWTLGFRGSPSQPAISLRPVRPIEAIGIIVLTIALMIIHQPRSTRLFLLAAPPVLEEEGIWAAKPMWRPRAIFLLDERAERQRRFRRGLIARDELRSEAIDQASIRRAFGRVIGSAPSGRSSSATSTRPTY